MPDQDPANITCVVPVLLTNDLEATIDFYTKKLGFRIDFRHGEPTILVGLSRGEASIHYAAATPTGPRNSAAWQDGNHPADVNFFLKNVDALYEDLQRRGAPVKGKPSDQSYGIRDLDIQDPNGYVLRFNQIL